MPIGSQNNGAVQVRTQFPRRVATVGLTPLIDMIFLLLLFFLLDSDFVSFGQAQIAPPRGAGGEASAAQPVVIRLGADGAMSWNGALLTSGEATAQTKKTTQKNAETVFVVMPAARANVQQVTDVWDALAEGGARVITLERDVFDIDLSDF